MTEDAPQEAHLSGPGIRELFADWVQLNDAETDDDEPDLTRVWLMQTKFSPPSLAVSPVVTPPAWGFPYHTACWRVMAEVCSDDAPDPQLLFDLCRSFPVQQGVMNWGHDYGGSICYEERRPHGIVAGEEAQILRPLRNAIYQHDPFDLPDLWYVFENQVDAGFAPRDLSPQHLSLAAPGYRDGFFRLPTEILQLILTYLPTPDMVSLKRASRIYADLPLHDQFWRSRFWAGHEFAFVFEATHFSSITRGRWKSVYFWVLDRYRTPSFTNRRRVWSLAYSLWGLLCLVSEASCDGSAVETPPSHLGVRWVTASRALMPLERDFSLGSRAFYERSISVSEKTSALFVSVIEIHGCRYVSGIRIQRHDGGSSSLGYRHPQHEVLVSSDKGGRLGITGFLLAQDQRGIRGLSVLTDVETLSTWVGDYEGIPRRRLVASSAGPILINGLKGGFDVSLCATHSVFCCSNRLVLRL